jgi:hypothetical protein
MNLECFTNDDLSIDRKDGIEIKISDGEKLKQAI